MSKLIRVKDLLSSVYVIIAVYICLFI